MDKQIDPKSYGLSSRDKLADLSPHHMALVIDRKSRIIMSDGTRILEKIRIIQDGATGMKVSLMTDTPMCSKTRKFLGEKGIDILPIH